MQRGAGDEGFVLRAVEPVAREGMTEVCHVDAKLMRATRLWAQAQEREAVVYLQSLVLCEARKSTTRTQRRMMECPPRGRSALSMTPHGGSTVPRR